MCFGALANSFFEQNEQLGFLTGSKRSSHCQDLLFEMSGFLQRKEGKLKVQEKTVVNNLCNNFFTEKPLKKYAPSVGRLCFPFFLPGEILPRDADESHSIYR